MKYTDRRNPSDGDPCPWCGHGTLGMEHLEKLAMRRTVECVRCGGIDLPGDNRYMELHSLSLNRQDCRLIRGNTFFNVRGRLSWSRTRMRFDSNVGQHENLYFYLLYRDLVDVRVETRFIGFSTHLVAVTHEGITFRFVIDWPHICEHIRRLWSEYRKRVSSTPQPS